MLFAQFLELFGVNRAIVHKGHAHVLNTLEFLAQQVMVQAGTGNHLLKLAAHDGVGFVHGDVVPQTGKLPGSRKAANTAADHANVLAGAGCGLVDRDIRRTGTELADLYGAVQICMQGLGHTLPQTEPGNGV